MKKTIRFLITGVGGQGTILASDILAEVGLRLGHDAKKSDILGLAVRGGSVVSHIIWGENVRAPMIDRGTADYYLSFEWLEGLRRLVYTNKDTVVLANDWRIDPVSVSSGQADYPDEDGIRAAIPCIISSGQCLIDLCPKGGKITYQISKGGKAIGSFSKQSSGVQGTVCLGIFASIALRKVRKFIRGIEVFTACNFILYGDDSLLTGKGIVLDQISCILKLVFPIEAILMKPVKQVFFFISLFRGNALPGGTVVNTSHKTAQV